MLFLFLVFIQLNFEEWTGFKGNVVKMDWVALFTGKVPNNYSTNSVC